MNQKLEEKEEIEIQEKSTQPPAASQVDPEEKKMIQNKKKRSKINKEGEEGELASILWNCRKGAKARQKVDTLHRTVLRLLRRFYFKLFCDHNRRLSGKRFINCAPAELVNGMNRVLQR